MNFVGFTFFNKKVQTHWTSSVSIYLQFSWFSANYWNRSMILNRWPSSNQPSASPGTEPCWTLRQPRVLDSRLLQINQFETLQFMVQCAVVPPEKPESFLQDRFRTFEPSAKGTVSLGPAAPWWRNIAPMEPHTQIFHQKRRNDLFWSPAGPGEAVPSPVGPQTDPDWVLFIGCICRPSCKWSS